MIPKPNLPHSGPVFHLSFLSDDVRRLRLEITSLDHWYHLLMIYNRGGYVSTAHLVPAMAVRERRARAIIQEWYDRDLIIPAANPSLFSATKTPQIYRVSNTFLRTVGDGDSHIRRKVKALPKLIRDATQGAALHHIQITAPDTWHLIDRRDRRTFLEDCGFTEDDLPSYIQTHDHRTISVNNEVFHCHATDEIRIVYCAPPLGSLTADWGEGAKPKAKGMGFFPRWRRILIDPRVAVLVIAPTQTAINLFSGHRNVRGRSLAECWQGTASKTRPATQPARPKFGVAPAMGKPSTPNPKTDSIRLYVYETPEAYKPFNRLLSGV